ncbi:response regulator transcription factor [Paenibacillus hodogayensis]|uniref:Response regulator transcription factor n=1 Tax=Paenibacillus hodogayensis TaxID=279208 RepID=A0ABV5VR31_9BACL
MSRKKILVVDDEPSISMLIEFNLKLVGYEVQCVYDGEAVFEVLPQFRPDLIVLDLMLPKLDGIQVCKRLRDQNNFVPIVMLTALQDLSDKIAGLDNGADDYMTKPFSPQELISRIQAVMRRTSALPIAEPETLHIGPIRIQPDQREVLVNDKAIELTPKEFELLLFLCKHRGKVLSRQQLLHGVWDYHFIGDTRIVDVHISHLRDKIEQNARNPEYIVTIRNVGYKLTEQTAKESLA